VKVARQWALDIYELKRPWIKSLYKTDKLEPLGEAKEILKFARGQAQKQAANLHHPQVCIDAIEEGIVAGPQAGLWKVFDFLHAPSLFLTFCHYNVAFSKVWIHFA
jgi:enoyl-CoA hydratase/3-hydroxyacyl-CoA dehydrogenase